MTDKPNLKDDFERRETILAFQDSLKLNATLQDAVLAEQGGVVKAILAEEGFVLSSKNCTNLFNRAYVLNNHDILLDLVSHPSFHFINGVRTNKESLRDLNCLLEKDWSDVLAVVKKQLSTEHVNDIYSHLSNCNVWNDYDFSRNCNWNSLQLIATPFLINRRFTDNLSINGDVCPHTLLSHAIEQKAWDQVDFYLDIEDVDPLIHKQIAYKALKKAAKKSERAQESLVKMETLIQQQNPKYFGRFKKPHALKL